ncbi:MAG: ChaN family lipoprotein [Maritimibacter sp.]
MFRSLSLAALAVCAPLTAFASPFAGANADIFVLGEVHDNPAHHVTQAEAIKDIAPRVVVYEMLSEDQAGRVSDDLLTTPEALGERLEWDASGWPDFAIYYPVFAAARGAVTRGAAVPRDVARAALADGIVTHFGADSTDFGLDVPLIGGQLADRLNLQLEAHCGAMPTELLPGMVELQRLRDATLAREALDAFDEVGGPVVVITGNGHARKDWGVPSYLAQVRPELRVVSLGQSEDGTLPEGGFDMIIDAPSVERDDPCAAFE